MCEIRPFRLSAFLIWAIALSWCGNHHAYGQQLTEIQISEFVADNDQGLTDSDGDRSDWIELWNASGIHGNLEGWYLTDDPGDLTRWTFPSVEIGSGGFVVIFASGKDRRAQEELHTNFKLQSNAGGYLALVEPDGETIASEFRDYPEQFPDISHGVELTPGESVALVENGAVAKWFVPSAPIAEWMDPAFDDSGWFSATTGIGFDAAGDYDPHFGSGDSLIDRMRSVNASAYIRIPFTASNPNGITDFKLRMKWEDGFVAYLNGQEIHRERAPEDLGWDSTSEPATGRDENEAVQYSEYELAGGALIRGTNVLAIQGLNESLGSSDFLISPELVATKYSAEPTAGYFTEITPGARNQGIRYDGIIADTKFSVDRGFFDAGFELDITSRTPGVTIMYTTDGSEPTESNGSIFAERFRVDRTAVIRAMAFREGFLTTDVDTQTYIFPEDVVEQDDMRREVTEDPEYQPQLFDALNSVPTIAVSFKGSDINRRELPVSIELLNFENGSHQANAGAVRVGGLFTNYAKHSIRLHFRSEYGAKRLKYPVFDGREYPTIPVETFDALDLRAGNQDMVHRGAYLSNAFADDSMLAMGQPAPHGRFVHVYFNGEYRGMYHLRERFHSAMLADYFPGEAEDYTTIDGNNSGNNFSGGALQNGRLADWSQIRSGLARTPRYSEVRQVVNVTNLIDFMLLWTSGSCEAEFRSVGSPANGVGFVFHMKDADGFLRPPDLIDNDPRNRTFAFVHSVRHNGPVDSWARLLSEGDPDFKTLLADRIHLHFFNGGTLTPDSHIARLRRRFEETRLSYITEFARWGRHDGTPNRPPAEWEAYQVDLMENQFPVLASRQIAKFIAAGMYSETIAPVLSQHGGSLLPDDGLTMSSNTRRIYYTIDGSDPRLDGGEINPLAVSASFPDAVAEPQDFVGTGDLWRYLDDASNQGTRWRAPDFDDRRWDEGPSELGFGESDEATKLQIVDLNPEQLGIQYNATSYFRKKFAIGDPGLFSSFVLSLKYDDAAAVYVNGVEAIRTDNLPADAGFDTYATESSPDENAYHDFELPVALFASGENTVAVEMHNASATSGDLSFDLRLRGETGQIANTTDPISILMPTELNARAYVPETGEWSALTSAFFSINSIPASSANIAISEIHYNPAKPVKPDEIAVSTDADDYEFIELFNTSNRPVDLTGVFFSDGIRFSFSDNTILEPGARTVIVSDPRAFVARYGTALPVGGDYSGKLSNSGENLSLSIAGGDILHALTFDDHLPWPTTPDGGGQSLILIDPSTKPNHAIVDNWTANATIGGSPGMPDPALVAGFAAWKLENNITEDGEDSDRDGIPAIMEYALGSSPTSPSPQALPVPGIIADSGKSYLTISFAKNPLAQDIVYQVQSSIDLVDWQIENVVEVSPRVFRASNPIRTDLRQQLLRLLIQLDSDQ